MQEQFGTNHVAELRPVRIFGDSILTQRTAEVDVTSTEFYNVAADLTLAFMKVTQLGVANAFCMSAPQIGHNARMFIIRDDNLQTKMRLVMNPIIVRSVGEQLLAESCLSIPGITVTVKRPEHIVLQYDDHEGVRRTIAASHEAAALVCHNVDHLDGKLMIDQLSVNRRRRVLHQHSAFLRRAAAKKQQRAVM